MPSEILSLRRRNKRKRWTMRASVKSIASRADINYVFLIYIFSWTDVSRFWQKKTYHTGVDCNFDDGHRVLVICSGTKNRTDRQSCLRKRRKKRNWTLIAFVQHHLYFSSLLVVCQSKRIRVVQLEHDCEKKRQYSLSILVP
jgi:hypothetical protein